MYKKSLVILSLAVSMMFQGCSDDTKESKQTSIEIPQKQVMTFTTGGVNGVYYPQGMIISKSMSENGHSMKVVSSEGGEQNGRRVAKNLADFGLIQKDTHTLLSTMDVDYSQNVNVVNKLGQESIFIVVNTESDIKSIKDIQKNKVKIAMTSASAGSVSTLKTMGKLDSSFEGKEVIYRDLNQSIKELKLGTIDAFMFVQSVGSKNKNLETILTDKSLAFINIDVDNLTSNKLNGKKVYDKCNVSVLEGYVFDKKVNTICTEALVISNANLKDEITNTLFNIIEKNKEAILKAEFKK